MIKSNEIIAITFFMVHATFGMNVDEAKAINCRVFLLQLSTLGVDVRTLVVPSQGESIVRRMVERKGNKRFLNAHARSQIFEIVPWIAPKALLAQHSFMHLWIKDNARASIQEQGIPLICLGKLSYNDLFVFMVLDFLIKDIAIDMAHILMRKRLKGHEFRPKRRTWCEAKFRDNKTKALALKLSHFHFINKSLMKSCGNYLEMLGEQALMSVKYLLSSEFLCDGITSVAFFTFSEIEMEKKKH